MRIDILQRAMLGCSASAMLALTPAPAMAQAAPSAAGATEVGLGEIIVTARKASELLKQTPVAVTAVTAEQIQTAQIRTVFDLQRVAPSLTTATGGPGGTGVLFLAIRGQTNNYGSSTNDPAIATYVDGVVIARPTAGNFALLDVAQTEVLRGPQGTLFGRNTTGGALNIRTVDPQGRLEGYLRGEYGNFDSKKVEGAVSVPIQGDELGVRVAASYQTHDGYGVRAVEGGSIQALDYAWSARATLKWAPSSLPLTVTLRGDMTRFKDNGIMSDVVAINTDFTPFPGFPTLGQVFALNGWNPTDYIIPPNGTAKFFATYGDTRSYNRSEFNPIDYGRVGGVSATIEAEIGKVDLKSITAWRQTKSGNGGDLDGMPLRAIGFRTDYHQRQFSEELTVSTKLGNLDLIAGGFYFRETGGENSLSAQYNFITDLFGLPTTFTIDPIDIVSESKALFAQANYHITPSLRITGGYRWTWDKRSLVRHSQSQTVGQPIVCTLIPGASIADCNQQFNASFSYPAWTIGIDYKVSDDVFTYLKSSSASLAGGFNPRPAPPGRQAFGPEKATDIEAGVKVSTLNNRVRANLAVYRSWGKDVQRAATLQVGNNYFTTTTNTGSTRNYGAEFDMAVVPWHGMELTMGAAYLHARYKAGSYLDLAPSPTTPGTSVVVDRSGEPIAQAPKWSYNFGFTQKFDLPIGGLSVHADYQWVDEKVFTSKTATPGASAADIAAAALYNKYGKVPSYGVLNGRAALEMDNGLELSVFARNIAQKKYLTYIFNLYDAGFANASPGAPRTYGVGVSYKF